MFRLSGLVLECQCLSSFAIAKSINGLAGTINQVKHLSSGAYHPVQLKPGLRSIGVMSENLKIYSYTHFKTTKAKKI